MRAIVIDAKKKEIYEVDITGDLKSLQGIVGGYVELATNIANCEDLFVNEEGLIDGTQEFFTYKGAHQPFAGTGVIIGCNDEGESVSTKMGLQHVKNQVTFLDLATVRSAITTENRNG